MTERLDTHTHAHAKRLVNTQDVWAVLHCPGG